jgi:hypothetical protein
MKIKAYSFAISKQNSIFAMFLKDDNIYIMLYQKKKQLITNLKLFER